jgi:hypothetical protein
MLFSNSEITGSKVKFPNGPEIFFGPATTRAALRAQVGREPLIGSLYVSTAGKLYVKTANANADTDWQKVTSTAAD